MNTNSPIDEEWRDAVGYEGVYRVSAIGDVMSLRQSKSPHYISRRKSPLLTAHFTHEGYLHVVLRINGKNYTHLVHHLVAYAFIGERPNGMVINHRDGDKLNNYVGNLEYVTQKANMEHARDKGLVPSGEQCPTSKLTHIDVQKIRELYAVGSHTQVALSRMFGVKQTAIHNVVTLKTWKHTPTPQHTAPALTTTESVNS